MVIEVPDVEEAYRSVLTKRLPIRQELTTQPWGHRAFCLQEPNGLTLYVFGETRKREPPTKYPDQFKPNRRRRT